MRGGETIAKKLSYLKVDRIVSGDYSGRQLRSEVGQVLRYAVRLPDRDMFARVSRAQQNFHVELSAGEEGKRGGGGAWLTSDMWAFDKYGRAAGRTLVECAYACSG